MSQLTSGFINSMLGRYHIQERLGAGGMASVFKAVDTNLDRTVAIKILHEHLVHEDSFKDRFQQEAKLIASLNHPNIVQLYDFAIYDRGDKEAPLYYMVMPYISGQTLEDLLALHQEMGSRMSQDQIQQIMLDLTAALDYAHHRGMVHRDVKPANVLFDETGRAILADFGIARLAESSRLTQEGVTVGTPAYMSPEQATGVVIDYRSDIYSLGVMFYEMLAGKLPYSSENNISILLQHVNEPIPTVSMFLPHPNPNLDTIIMRAMAKDMGDRYQSASEFAADCRAAFSEEQLPAYQPKTITMEALAYEPMPAEVITPAKRKQRQSPLGIFAIGMTAIVIILFLGMLARRGNPGTIVEINASGVPEAAVDSMTGEEFFFTSTFDGDDPTLTYWDQTSGGTMSREVTNDGTFRLTNTRTNTATTTLIDEAYTYHDVKISMEARLLIDNEPASAYGIAFRYLDMDNYNVFAVDGRGRYSIWVRENGAWQELRQLDQEWTETEAVATIGDYNLLTLEVLGDRLTGFVNNEMIFELEDSTFDEGAIGVYMATTSRGAATIDIDMFSVSESTPTTEAMTDDSSVDSMTDDVSVDSMTNESDAPAEIEAHSD